MERLLRDFYVYRDFLRGGFFREFLYDIFSEIW